MQNAECKMGIGAITIKLGAMEVLVDLVDLVDGVDGVDGVEAVDRRGRPWTLTEDGPNAAIRGPDSACLALITQERIAFKYGLSTEERGKAVIFAMA